MKTEKEWKLVNNKVQKARIKMEAQLMSHRLIAGPELVDQLIHETRKNEETLYKLGNRAAEIEDLAERTQFTSVPTTLCGKLEFAAYLNGLQAGLLKKVKDRKWHSRFLKREILWQRNREILFPRGQSLPNGNPNKEAEGFQLQVEPNKTEAEASNQGDDARPPSAECSQTEDRP
jgi:hypothetical protein